MTRKIAIDRCRVHYAFGPKAELVRLLRRRFNELTFTFSGLPMYRILSTLVSALGACMGVNRLADSTEIEHESKGFNLANSESFASAIK